MIAHKDGHIVQVSSVQGLIGLPQRSAYSASKHALQAFSDCLRAEVMSHNICVTVVSPGYLRTQLSVNALTGDGSVHGKMDETTENGYSAEYVAKAIVHAVVKKRKEVIIATVLPKLAIFLRKYFPSVYFYVMAIRARKLV